jgi:hypothetical protein
LGLDFRAQNMNFEEADRRHAELARQRAAGELSPEEVEARGRDLMVLDEYGRWWIKEPSSGAWNYHDGTNWLPGTPPGHREAAPPSLPVTQHPPEHPDGTTSPAPYPAMQDASVSQGAPPYESAAPHAAPARRRRGIWRWLLGLVVTVAILAFVGVAVVALLFYISNSGSEVGRQQQNAEPQGGGASSEGGGASDSDAGESSAGAVGFDAAFVHTSTDDNITANSTYLDHPLLNGNPDAVVYVTQNWNPSGSGGTYNDHPVGVWYNENREMWAVFNQDRAGMPRDASFNVAVLKEVPEE